MNSMKTPFLNLALDGKLEHDLADLSSTLPIRIAAE